MLTARRRRQLSATAADVSGFREAGSILPTPAAPLTRLDGSFRKLIEAGGAFTERFLERVSASYPGVRDALPGAGASVGAELLGAIGLVLAHRRDPAAAEAELRALGREYAQRGLRPPHYRLICELLVRSIADLCGSEWDAELECEWTSSLSLGASAMIEGVSTAGVPAAKPS